jgi:hypothetical protein
MNKTKKDKKRFKNPFIHCPCHCPTKNKELAKSYAKKQ